MKDPFTAIIRFRAPPELKARLTAIAGRRRQDLSEYLRQRCLDIVEEHELAEDRQAAPTTAGLVEKLRAQHESEKAAASHISSDQKS